MLPKEGGQKSEDNDNRTFCRSRDRRRAGRPCPECIKQNTGQAASRLQETPSDRLRLCSEACDARQRFEDGLSGRVGLHAQWTQRLSLRKFQASWRWWWWRRG